MINHHLLSLSNYNGLINIKKGDYYLPYLACGTAGLINVLINYENITFDSRYHYLIIELGDSVMLRFSKSTNFMYGLSGIGWINLKLYKHLNKKEFICTVKDICDTLLCFTGKKGPYNIFMSSSNQIDISPSTGLIGHYLFLKETNKILGPLF